MPTSERVSQPVREKLPGTRPSFVRRFHIRYVEDDETGKKVAKELKFYLQPGMYDDGRLGELLIRGDKEGGLLSGALNALGTMISLNLQHGVPLKLIIEHLRHQKFGPSGFTGDQEFKSCSSLFDLIAQYLQARFPDGKYKPKDSADGHLHGQG